LKDNVSRHFEEVEGCTGTLVEVALTLTTAELLIAKVGDFVEADDYARAAIGAVHQWLVGPRL
jgi:hypothetical protein